MTFEDFNLSKQLLKAINDLSFDKPTTIQEKAFSVIKSGKDVVGLAQTGTGKTFAFLLPILELLKYSNQFDGTLTNINSTILFDCNGRIIYNDEKNSESSTVEKFLLESNYKTKFLNVGICDESFEYFFEDHPYILSFSAKKIKF